VTPVSQDNRHRGFTARSSPADLGEKHGRHPGCVNDTLPTTTYISRVLNLPAGIVRSVFDGCRADRQAVAGASGAWSIVAEGVVLDLGNDLVGADEPTDPFTPLRQCSGRLRVRRGPLGSVPVHLEVLQWSRTATEIGLRLMRNRQGPASYPESAAIVIEVLVAELELRGLLATHPAHATGTDRVPGRVVTASAWL